ncbi:hypothetical protein CDD83_10463 [Cordyceps sp. RAO-2017]|nr:hypothetical protein CDD83_10463 [Cordyceps sp. RAO-2017]
MPRAPDVALTALPRFSPCAAAPAIRRPAPTSLAAACVLKIARPGPPSCLPLLLQPRLPPLRNLPPLLSSSIPLLLLPVGALNSLPPPLVVFLRTDSISLTLLSCSLGVSLPSPYKYLDSRRAHRRALSVLDLTPPAPSSSSPLFLLRRA